MTDQATQATSVRFDDVRAIIFDLDGTLIRGGSVLPGALDVIARLRRNAMPFLFCTQEAESDDDAIVARLNRMGFAIERNDVVSGGTVILEYLARYGSRPIHVIGTPRQKQYLIDHGVRLAEKDDEPRVLLVGLYAGFAAENLEQACRLVWQGADFLAYANDRSFPLDGSLVPGTGALVKSIEHATRRRARILAKPSAEIAGVALRRLGLPAASVLVIGDNADVDIRMGKNAGCPTALVLSGSTSAAQTRHIPARSRPDAIFENVAALLDCVKLEIA